MILPMRLILTLGAAFGCLPLGLSAVQERGTDVPKVWDESAMADWATPIAALNVRPGHYSEAEYYRAPIDNLRTYPVYYPGREPAGYKDMLETVGPQPLIESSALKTESDWMAAGRRVFTEYDMPAIRTLDPALNAAARDVATFANSRVTPRPDGTLPDVRWIPTAKGVALGISNCAGCHTTRMPDNTFIHRAPRNEDTSPLLGRVGRWGPSNVPLPGDTIEVGRWRAWTVPWITDDIHAATNTMSPANSLAVLSAAVRPGLFPRWNGSPYYVTKIPDLIGIKDRKYIDHTATHLHRNAADLMRYAALVTYSDLSDFGGYRVLTESQRGIPLRLPDQALYALTQYIYALQPPTNPNQSAAGVSEGQKVFESQGCGGCHTPPLYTNNKVTLAQGFTPAPEGAASLDVLRVSVGTDPNLALKTRKGTGYYKVPSLKGVWYRGHYLHDGSFTTLEEMFDPARLDDAFVPSGFMPAGVQSRAVKGHTFGLALSPDDRKLLLAFLRSL
jgi:mono/diheme cytochrome c family protein